MLAQHLRRPPVSELALARASVSLRRNRMDAMARQPYGSRSRLRLQQAPGAVHNLVGRARARHEVHCAARAVLQLTEADMMGENGEPVLTPAIVDKEELRTRKEDISKTLSWVAEQLVC